MREGTVKLQSPLKSQSEEWGVAQPWEAQGPRPGLSVKVLHPPRGMCCHHKTAEEHRASGPQERITGGLLHSPEAVSSLLPPHLEHWLQLTAAFSRLQGRRQDCLSTATTLRMQLKEGLCRPVCRQPGSRSPPPTICLRGFHQRPCSCLLDRCLWPTFHSC